MSCGDWTGDAPRTSLTARMAGMAIGAGGGAVVEGVRVFPQMAPSETAQRVVAAQAREMNHQLAQARLRALEPPGNDAKVLVGGRYVLGAEPGWLNADEAADLQATAYALDKRNQWFGGTAVVDATGLGAFVPWRAPSIADAAFERIYERIDRFAGRAPGEAFDVRSLLTMSSGQVFERGALAIYHEIFGLQPTAAHYEAFTGRDVGPLVVPDGAHILLTTAALPTPDALRAALDALPGERADWSELLLRQPIVTSPDGVAVGVRAASGPQYWVPLTRADRPRPVDWVWSPTAVVEVKSRRAMTGPASVNDLCGAAFAPSAGRQICAEFVQLLVTSLALGAPADLADAPTVRALDIVHYYVNFDVPSDPTVTWTSKSGMGQMFSAFRAFIVPGARGELAGLVLACAAALRNLTIMAALGTNDEYVDYLTRIEPLYRRLIERLNDLDDPAWAEVGVLPLVANLDPLTDPPALAALERAYVTSLVSE